jgi:transcriptional regulator with XRE-family HTH domain
VELITEQKLTWRTLMARRRATSIPPTEDFGPRLARLRQSRGLTQEVLGARVGQSNRMIAYYEREDAEPPGALLPALAHALGVTTDQLLGVTPLSDTTPARTARLRRRLQLVEQLPPADQRTVLTLVDALAQARQRSRPRPRRQAS